MEVIIIGGFPRAGTRQFTDILNAHSKVVIKGECFPKVVRGIASVFRAADDKHSGRWSDEKYREWRVRSALNFYAGVSKGSNAPFNFSGLLAVGFKSPRVELIYDDLGALFFKEKIKFFFCVRKVEDNFLSENSTFGISVQSYVSETVRSLNCFFSMLSDDRFECSVLSLDDYIASDDRGRFVKDIIFRKLNSVAVSEDEANFLIDSTKNINSTESSGKVRRTELTAEERSVLFGSVELLSFNEKLKSFFGVSIY